MKLIEVGSEKGDETDWCGYLWCKDGEGWVSKKTFEEYTVRGSKPKMNRTGRNQNKSI